MGVLNRCGTRGRRTLAAACAVALSSAVLATSASPVQAASCVSGQWRAADAASGGPGSYDGVNAQMYVPPLSALGNYASYSPGGDIYVISGGGDMVQFGWTVYHGATRLWWKESIPGHSETGPTPSQTISTGFHNFRLLWLAAYNGSGQPIPAKYGLYIDSTSFAQTADTHPYNEPQASVTGEQDNSCGVIDNKTVRNPSPPYGTLWFHTEPTGWVFWTGDDRWAVNPPGTSEYTSNGIPDDTPAGIGTDYAYGGY
jgi:hypothetical protein